VSFNGVGFGHGRFGHFPFGKSDFGDEVVVRSFSDVLLEDEDDPTGINQRLLGYLRTIRDSVNRTKTEIDQISDQVDFDKVRDDLIVHLGRTIGVEIDDAEPAEFRRALVANAVLFYRIKGTVQSYKIRGKISGFDIDVFNMFRIDPSLLPFFDPEDIFEIPFGSGIWYTDRAPGEVPGTPTEITCDYCLTSAIKLSFTIVKEQPPAIAGQANFTDRVIAKLRDIVPIHVRELLFEIVAIILVDEHQNIKVEGSQVETSFIPVPAFARFDAFSVDSMPLDAHGGIAGTTNESPA